MSFDYRKALQISDEVYRERQRQEEKHHADDVRPHEYVYDGVGPIECTFTELNGIKCGLSRENHGDGSSGVDFPDGTSITKNAHFARMAQNECKRAFRRGEGTWWHILFEEVIEAGAEEDWPSLRKELIQVIAVGYAWIEAGDRRTGDGSTQEEAHSETDGRGSQEGG